MGRAGSEVGSRTNGRQVRAGSLGAGSRKVRLVVPATESLELRTLLAVLPSFILGTVSPGAPPAPELEHGSDTGSSDSDHLTRANLAPVFDVGTAASPVDPGMTVALYRTPLDAGDNAVGPAVLVNTNANVNGGIVSIADDNAGRGAIPDGTYLYAASLTDAAGHAGPMGPGLKVTIDATAPATPPQPVLVNDTGTSSNDAVTSANNSAISPATPNAPVFNILGVEPHATVVLDRNGLEIARLSVTAGGTVAITDLNGGSLPGQAPIPDGIYLYKVRQIDAAGNPGQFSAELTITIDRTAPLAPSPPVLEPASDTSNGLAHTTKNNGPGPQDAPVFDVPDVEPGAGVILYRAPVLDGVVGTFVRVNALATTAGGTVAIADINQADPKLATPGPEIPDGTYVYQARQVDLAGNAGPLSASGATVTIDTTAPLAPSALRLDPASDTGISHDDAITQITLSGLPVFDISGVEGYALVRLYRTGPGGGTSTLVGSVFAQGSSTPVDVRIPDVSASTPDGTYLYTAQQVDQAGNVGALSPEIRVIYDTSQPPTPGAAALDPGSQTGGGDPPTTSVRTPSFQIVVAVPGSKANSCLVLLRDGIPVTQGSYDLSTGTITISDPGPVSDGVHTYQAFLIDPAGNRSEVSAGVDITFAPDVPGTPALDPASDSGTQGDNITNLTGDLTFNVSVATPGNAVQLYRDGQLVGVRNGPGPIIDTGPALTDGTHLYTARQVDEFGTTSEASDPLNVTIVTRAAAPSGVRLGPSSDSGTQGDQITNVDSDLSFDVLDVAPGATVVLLRDGVSVVRLTSPVGGKVTIVDPGPLSPGTYDYAAAQIDGAGNTSADSPPVSIRIVTASTTRGDYNGDGKADIAMFRRVGPSAAQWFISGEDEPSSPLVFGSGTLDVPFQGDLDGDGKTDLILYRPSTSQWFVQQSSRGFAQFAFGGPGDLPAVGDFDGLGHDQLAVYRPGTGQWFVAGHGGVYDTFGGPADMPVPLRNFYGAGRDVLAVYRPGTSEWFVAGQGSGTSFGGVGDLPVPLYNIYGDGRDVLGVFRPSTSTWYVGGQVAGISFGGAGDVAVAADFDGIGHDELAVYRPSTGEWFVGGHGEAVATFGSSSDIPLGSPYAYRALPGTVGSSGAPSGSAPDVGGNLLTMAIGLKSAPTTSSAGVTQASTSNSAGPVSSPPATQAPTGNKRPNQTSVSSRGHVHDLALASLKSFGKRLRANRFLGS